MISVNPWSRRDRSSHSSTGFPMTGISGFGISGNRAEILVPRPPAIITVFIDFSLSTALFIFHAFRSRPYLITGDENDLRILVFHF